jgi:hypothetical protein
VSHHAFFVIAGNAASAFLLPAAIFGWCDERLNNKFNVPRDAMVIN